MSPRLALALLISAFLSGPAFAIGEGVEPVDACMRSSLPEKTSKQTINLISTDRTGGTTRNESTLIKRFASTDNIRGIHIPTLKMPGTLEGVLITNTATSRIRILTWTDLRRIRIRVRIIGSRFCYVKVDHRPNIIGGLTTGRR